MKWVTETERGRLECRERKRKATVALQEKASNYDFMNFEETFHMTYMLMRILIIIKYTVYSIYKYILIISKIYLYVSV